MEVSEMDQKCARIAETKAKIAGLEEEIEELKGSIRELQAEVEQYYVETNREAPYVSPFGTLYLHTDIAIKQPKGEALKKLFQHFVLLHGEALAWERMSIHNQTLKSELKDHIRMVEERGGDPVLEPLPGVEAPTTLKQLRFRKKKG